MKRWLKAGLWGMCVLSVATIFYLRATYHPSKDRLYNRAARLILVQSQHAGRTPVLAALAQRVGIDKWSTLPYEMDFSALKEWPQDKQVLQLRGLLDDGGSEIAIDIVKHPDEQNDPACFLLGMKTAYQIDEDATLEAVTKLTQADPENAFDHYMKALLLIDLGELEDADDEMKEGNAAKRCDYPLPYPANMIASGNFSLRSVQDQQVAGVLWASLCGRRSLTYWTKEASHNLMVAASLGYPFEIEDDFLMMLKRIGQARNVPLTEQWSASQVAVYLLKYIHDNNLILTPQQEREYKSLQEQLNRIQAQMQAAMNPKGQTIYDPFGPTVPALPFTSKEMLMVYYGYFDRHDITNEMFRAIGRDIPKELSTVRSVGPLFDCLDPPPLSRWADSNSQTN